MDGKLDGALQQRLLDLLGEQALAADLVQLAVLDPVAGGADDHDLGFGQVGPGGLQPVADQMGLGQRQRTAARADAQGPNPSGHGRLGLGIRLTWRKSGQSDAESSLRVDRRLVCA